MDYPLALALERFQQKRLPLLRFGSATNQTLRANALTQSEHERL
jgi:hypothetical protein